MLRTTRPVRPPPRPTAAPPRRARPAAAPRRRPRPPTPPPPAALPFELAWGTALGPDGGQTVASNLFAASLFPYLAFLWLLARVPRAAGAHPLLVTGCRLLLVFVGASIPAGIYCKVVLHRILADVDVVHGGAESLLTLTNITIVLGLRAALREAEAARGEAGEGAAEDAK